MEKEIICISCPIGCHLKVAGTGKGEITVTGNQCPRGEIYGKEEFLEPKRVVTAVVKTNSVIHPYVSVKTDKPLLREYIFQLLKKLYSIEVKVPLTCGEKVIENFRNTGVSVVFTRSVKRR